MNWLCIYVDINHTFEEMIDSWYLQINDGECTFFCLGNAINFFLKLEIKFINLPQQIQNSTFFDSKEKLMLRGKWLFNKAR